tara:strand:+ start:2319 stop:4862 length:2544 start_codon:yes stop_codon:yes gene_type:complete
MKKIVITGGLGYIGMELCKVYSGETRNASITVLDRSFYSSRIRQLRRWGIDFKQVDILNENSLKEEIKDADIIYHLTEITDVGTTIKDKDPNRDKQILDVAINGTKNVLKYSKDSAKIIFPSSHVVFEGLKKQVLDIEENHKTAPVLPYSKGKHISEINIQKSGKDFVILRLGSVYGLSFDSMRLNTVTNLFAKISASNGQLNLFANGVQLKSLVSVVDVARCMKFVGENKKISKEVYNLANESVTVKQLADICKKVNKNLVLKYTNDDIPNNGYTLSNKKIKKTGFKFLYNLKQSVEEMHEVWKKQPPIKKNEILEVGKDNFVDDRGIISNYYFDDSINMIGYVESKKHTLRGNHYHPIQTQKCLLVKGMYISVTKDLKDENSVVETRLVREGELSTIPPNVSHTMVFLEDSILLNLVNGERDHKNYGITHTIYHELVSEKLFKNLIESYKTECRVCGGGFEHYLSLGLSPLANNLNDEKNFPNDLYPLDLNFCNQCSNSQLSVVVPPEKMFGNYFYLSSTSKQFRNHFVEIAKELKTNLKLNKKSVVVDIGSNDGVFLDPLQNLGIKAVGVEPAKNVAKIANSKKLFTLPEYFNEKTVDKIVKKYGKADVVTAFNVFAHGDGLKEILNNTEKLLKDSGEFVFEIQYLLRTIKDLTFDNVYHEHVNYWCLISILNFFKDSNMKVYKVKEVDTHGGSLRVYATKNKNKRLHKSVNQYIELELKNGLDNLETYKKFAKNVANVKHESLKRINQLLKEDKNIIGYGAPAKATTILNYFRIDEKYFKYVLEDSQIKHNKYIPETNIQIKAKKDLNIDDYEYILVLAWNFFDTIVKNNQAEFNKSKFIKLK